MATYTEGTRLSDIVRWEPGKNYSRDDITVANGENLAMGTVLGKVTSDETYKQIDFSATDGTENAAGILLEDVDASGGARKSIALVREAIILQEDLIWPSGATNAQKSAALSQLKELGIITR